MIVLKKCDILISAFDFQVWHLKPNDFFILNSVVKSNLWSHPFLPLKRGNLVNFALGTFFQTPPSALDVGWSNCLNVFFLSHTRKLKSVILRFLPPSPHLGLDWGFVLQHIPLKVLIVESSHNTWMFFKWIQKNARSQSFHILPRLGGKLG